MKTDKELLQRAVAVIELLIAAGDYLQAPDAESSDRYYEAASDAEKLLSELREVLK